MWSAAMLRLFKVTVSMAILTALTGCCSLGGGEVDCSLFLSQATPRQVMSLFQCSLLYDTKGLDRAYECLSQGTKKHLSRWKFRYGFPFLKYDKNEEIPLWRLLSRLQVEEVVEEDENHVILVCLVDDQFAAQYGQQYSEMVYLVREGNNWKIDLVRTMKERGLWEGLDRWEKDQSPERDESGGGCQLASSGTGSSPLSWLWLPLFLVWLIRKRQAVEKTL